VISSVVALSLKTARLLLCACLFALAAGRPVRAESVEVQAVAASDPGKTPVIPASLKKLDAQLKEEPFGTFTDSGRDTATADAGGTGSCNVGGYAVDIMIVAKAANGKVKVQVTCKKGGTAVGQPWKTELTSGHPMRMKVGDQKAPVIMFFTFKE
jgi:hypothetical protein